MFEYWFCFRCRRGIKERGERVICEKCNQPAFPILTLSLFLWLVEREGEIKF